MWQGVKKKWNAFNQNCIHGKETKRWMECWLIAGLLFDREDGGDMLTRNVGGLLSNYTALQLKRSHSLILTAARTWNSTKKIIFRERLPAFRYKRVVLCGCKTWSHAVGQSWESVFGNRTLTTLFLQKKPEVTGRWRRQMHNGAPQFVLLTRWTIDETCTTHEK
jgi:hypothetical protein